VAVYSGATQNVIEAFSAFAAYGGFHGGVTVAAADVKGDGKDAIIVGTATQFGVAAVFEDLSTQPAEVLNSGFLGGVNVAAGELAGAGHAQVLLGMATGAPMVAVFDGTSGSRVGQFSAFPGQSFGVRLATVDPTGTGHAQILTSFDAPFPVVGIYDGQSFGLSGGFLADVPGIPDSLHGLYVG
jgi:hypothetical protein